MASRRTQETIPRQRARRPGPRPLALHLAAATTLLSAARASWPLLKGGLLPWSAPLDGEAAALRRALAAIDPEAFDRALEAEVARRLDGFLDGIAAYRADPHRRTLDDPPAVWRCAGTRLLDYGATAPAAAAARPVLVVPSLINRAHVLDLDDGISLLRDLAGRGLRPLLLDWGAPGAEERLFTLTDYVGQRGRAALAAAAALAGGPVPVVGYCMGGLLALALAVLEPARVAALALLATPWDFHADGGAAALAVAAATVPLLAVLEAQGELPVDLLQALFLALDPMQGYRKFRRFGGLKGDARRRFVALEDWANDGVPLAGPVARECLFGWYVANTPGLGLWRVADMAVRPERCDMPALVVVPADDRIVPPASAEALVRLLPRSHRLAPQAGHVGMVVGRRARDALWAPLAAWLAAAG